MGATGLAADPGEYRTRLREQSDGQIDAWAQELAAGTCPAPILSQLYRILFKPDKNGPEYKAVVEAARATQTAPPAASSRPACRCWRTPFCWPLSSWRTDGA